ncbi:hypothetical protein IQ219_06545 [Synechocystis sp. LEGE 06083]|uniref:DUF4114 domain-containing protein n=1 Tax=Synechocystis sp. LEGE 06083 TaxID=915336 RepID=UPI00187E934C|nr:DUF4114 domain-containing protein [Synechocystis sp. LEGE 06083]MBE9194974.1 hypothetical protein [Synechocystis sp. LEGE 06083]
MAIFNDVDTFQELNDAIQFSKDNGEHDTINITGDSILSEQLLLINEDVGLVVNGNGCAVSGNNGKRIFFVKNGTFALDGLSFQDGKAQGTNSGVFGFEDLPSNLGISDFDFNNAVFQIQFLA